MKVTTGAGDRLSLVGGLKSAGREGGGLGVALVCCGISFEAIVGARNEGGDCESISPKAIVGAGLSSRNDGGWEGESCGDILDSCSEAVTILFLPLDGVRLVLPLDGDIVGLVDATLVMVLLFDEVGRVEAELIVPLDPVWGGIFFPLDP